MRYEFRCAARNFIRVIDVKLLEVVPDVVFLEVVLLEVVLPNAQLLKFGVNPSPNKKTAQRRPCRLSISRLAFFNFTGNLGLPPPLPIVCSYRPYGSAPFWLWQDSRVPLDLQLAFFAS